MPPKNQQTESLGEKLLNLLKNLNFWQLIATLIIAYSVHYYGEQRITMDAIAEFRKNSDKAWAQIKSLPEEYENLTFDQRDLVVIYLNEYEHFCTLYNEGMINGALAELTRRDTILTANDDYHGFIDSWRVEQKKPRAFAQLRQCAKSMAQKACTSKSTSKEASRTNEAPK